MLLCFPLYYLKKSIISIHGPRTAEAYSKQQKNPQRSKIMIVNSVGSTVVSLDIVELHASYMSLYPFYHRQLSQTISLQ